MHYQHIECPIIATIKWQNLGIPKPLTALDKDIYRFVCDGTGVANMLPGCAGLY